MAGPDFESGSRMVSSSPLPAQAPIGTRVRTSPKTELNPAAPTFKTLFSRKESKKVERAEKQERAAELERDREKERERDREFEAIHEEARAERRRRSRDTRSTHTEESVAGSHESLDRPDSVAAASDPGLVVGSAPNHRESIFQKISRKSSASKFNVPWKDKSIRVGKRATTDAGASASVTTTTITTEMDDDVITTDSPLGKSVDSLGGGLHIASGRTGILWSSLRRKSKRGDQAIIDETISSAPGDDDDEDGVEASS